MLSQLIAAAEAGEPDGHICATIKDKSPPVIKRQMAPVSISLVARNKKAASKGGLHRWQSQLFTGRGSD